MRICIEKATKRILEMQGGGDDNPLLMEARLDTLKQNAINTGYSEEDIEVKFVTDEELEAAKSEDPVKVALKVEQEAKEADRLEKAQEIIDSLPDWTTVKSAIDVAFPDTKQNNLITKTLRVVYILART